MVNDDYNGCCFGEWNGKVDSSIDIFASYFTVCVAYVYRQQQYSGCADNIMIGLTKIRVAMNT